MPTSTIAVSYVSAALAYLLFGMLLLGGARRRAHQGVFVLATVLTIVWAGVMSDVLLPGWAPWMQRLAELARSAAWTGLLLSLLNQWQWSARNAQLAAAAYGTMLLAMLLAPWLPAGLLFHLLGVGYLVLAVLGMLLVEQLYRDRSVQVRWAIKFLCIGLGAMFAYDFYLYSDMLLLRELDPELWAARGLVNALTAPLLAVSLLRGASWPAQLTVSRRAAFHSFALLGSAIYLLAMSLAAYYLRFVGGSWGSLMQLAFLFGASFLLLGVLFSGSFRAWLKVFISKHFYRYNYDYREEWLAFTRTLSQSGPNLGQRSLSALAALVESQGGLLWLRRGEQYEAVAAWQTPPQQAAEPADSPLCQLMEGRQWLVDLGSHAQVDPDVPLPDWLRAVPRAWLIVPLLLQGRMVGFAVLQAARSTVKLNWEVLDLLKIAGSQAASYLAQQEADNALMLARQFDSFNRLSTFVVHDLKNLVAQLSLLTANAEKHRDNPEFQRDMMETVQLSVQKMKLMLQKLSRSVSAEQAAPQDVAALLAQAVALKAAFTPRPTLAVAQAGLQVLAEGERLERVLGHLIQNAIEATPAHGSVCVRLQRDGEQVRIEVEDSGAGMDEEFVRERLFKPFDSTKSAGMGIGAFESREYIHQLGGQLRVRSAPEQGTTFTVLLPLYRQQSVEQAA